MVDIDRIRKGDVLITEESVFGQLRLFYGPVVLIDDERKEVAIKLGEEMRSFPVSRLWTIPSFIANRRTNDPQKPSPKYNSDKIQNLMGFVVALAEGKVNESTLQEIAEELKKQGAKPTAPQELLEVL